MPRVAELFCHVHFQFVECFSLDFLGRRTCFYNVIFYFFVACLFLFWFSFVFSTCKVLAWCGRCLFPAWQFGVLRVAAVRLPCGSVESCVWEGFVSDVAVWSLVRGRGSFLTWQCGVLRVARVPF